MSEPAELVVISKDTRPVEPLLLPGGVELEIRRPGAIDWRTAEIRAARIVRQIQDGGALAADWSPSDEMTGWELDPDQADALNRWVLCVCLAEILVTGWNIAVASEDDEAPTERSPVTAEGLRLLFSGGTAVQEPFLARVNTLLPIRIGAVEGNVSGPAPPSGSGLTPSDAGIAE